MVTQWPAMTLQSLCVHNVDSASTFLAVSVRVLLFIFDNSNWHRWLQRVKKRSRQQYPQKEENILQNQSYRDLLLLLLLVEAGRRSCCPSRPGTAPAWAAGGEPLTSAPQLIRAPPATLELPCNLLLWIARLLQTTHHSAAPSGSTFCLPDHTWTQHVSPVLHWVGISYHNNVESGFSAAGRQRWCGQGEHLSVLLNRT